jgi:hypothetical protein
MTTELAARLCRAREAHKIALGTFLAGIVLFLVFHPSLPYEQDQGSKLAVIYKLQMHGLSSLNEPPFFYKEKQQPLYYVISYWLFPVFGLRPYGAMNIVSVFAGMLFMGAMCYALRRTFAVPYWITWMLFISAPMFVLTFTFSNEIAVAMAFLTLSLAFVVSAWRFAYIFAGFFCGLAMWSYLPVVLLAPTFLCWAYFYPVDVSPNERIRRLLKLSAVFLLTVGAVWAVFVRAVPRVFPFEAPAPWAYRAAVVLYSSCPTILIISALALALILIAYTLKPRTASFLLLAWLPMLFFPGTFSHKHLLICSFAIVVPTAIAVAASPLWLRCILLSSVSLWFLFSVSPFGVYAPLRGSYIFLPTNDGPAPTGAYLRFYSNVKRGIYQEAYADEIHGIEKAIDALAATGFRAELAGDFNHHFVLPYLYRIGRLDWQSRLQIAPLNRWPQSGGIYLIRRSYLRSDYLSEKMNNQMDAWLERGRIRIVDVGDSRIFPAVVEVGDSVPEDADSALGRRILFARMYDKRRGMFESTHHSDVVSPLFWVPADETKNIPIPPAYSDAEFVAYTKPIPGASIWRLRLPAVLLTYTDPAAKRRIGQ